jgi:hypothetical protein
MLLLPRKISYVVLPAFCSFLRFLMLWCLWLLMFAVMVMEKGGDYDSVVLCLNCGVLIWWEVRKNCFILWYVSSIIWTDTALSENELISLIVLYYYPQLVMNLVVWMYYTIIHDLFSCWNHVDNNGLCQVGKPLMPYRKVNWFSIVWKKNELWWCLYTWYILCCQILIVEFNQMIYNLTGVTAD